MYNIGCGTRTKLLFFFFELFIEGTAGYGFLGKASFRASALG